MGQINTNNYPTVDSLADADLLIVENATNGTGTTTPKQLRENAIGTGTLQTSAQTVTGAINELKHEIDLGAGVARYDVNTITSGYLGQFSGSANLLLLHLTTDGIADATNGYMMMLSYSRPVARFAYGRLVDSDGVAYKQDVYADNTIICTISGSGEGTESDPVQVVILGIINAGFMLTPTAVVSDRDIIDGQGNTLSVLAEALTKTASGNPVVITDCAGGKARSLITEINAIQDLHGYDKPWVGGAGKNKFDGVYPDISSSTVQYRPIYVGNGTYTISTDCPKNSAEGANIFFLAGNAQAGASTQGNGVWNGRTITVTTDDGYVTVAYRSEGNVDPTNYNTQIESGSQATSFAPYSNICPISGRDSVAVDDVGKNIWPFGDFIGTYSDVPFSLKAGTYTASKANHDINCGLRFYYADGTSIAFTFFTSETFTLTADVVKINYSSASATTVNFQLERGSTATPYVPYAHSSATIQLGQTVYGADINWDTGVMTVDRAYLTVNDFTAMADNVSAGGLHYATTAQLDNFDTSKDVILSMLPYVRSGAWASTTPISSYGTKDIRVYCTETSLEAFKTAYADLQLVYPLATPTTIQLTPTEVQMLKGYNRVTIDNGSIELGYIAKLT
jgi:hypothetical protein